ncbi:MAG: hypothetical protein WDO16_18775 [Bacteroidota bacterium]
MMQAASGQAVTDSVAVPIADSLPAADTPVIAQDSLPLPVVQTADSVSKTPWLYPAWDINMAIPLSIQVLKHHPYYGFGSPSVVVYTGRKKFEGKDGLFYLLIGLLLAFAFLRQAFPKYFNDLFRLLFRTTLKQKQVREQLMQTPLPSLLLNAFS